MKKQKNKKTETGITLIALVVSIIVLIILAGVSIAMLIGQNGIITQAQTADELTIQAQQKEAIELAIASVQAQETLELDRTKLETALQSQLRDTPYTLTENEDGSYLLQIAERSYYIDSTGEVIAEENMVAIASAEELKAFRDDVNSGNTYEGKYVYLTSDITLDINEEWEPIGYYQNEDPGPYDENNKPFMGIFDGRFHKIEKMYINTSDRAQGLFGFIMYANVKNIEIADNCEITGGSEIGGLVGYVGVGCVIENCSNQANVIGYDQIGGIAGILVKDNIVSNCYNNGNIEILNNIEGKAGGIAGQTQNANDIKNCYNTGTIVAPKYSGGILGWSHYESFIENCYNVGIANKGIVGWDNRDLVNIINSYFLSTNSNGAVGKYDISNLEKNESEMLSENFINILGNAYKQDTDNINNGYPVLMWQ